MFLVPGVNRHSPSFGQLSPSIFYGLRPIISLSENLDRNPSSPLRLIRMPVSPVRLMLLIGGWISLGLGLLGILVPLLPTTPFILLAAWCFSKSSPRLHARLLNQPLLGPMIQNWEQEGSISQNAKVTATVCMIGLFGCSLFAFPFSVLLTIFLVCMGTGVLIFIWTRPKPSRHLNQLSNRPTDSGKNLVRLG